jgi:hypothetical protein
MTSEEKTTETSENAFWGKLAFRYWYLLVIFGVILAGAIIGFILTFNWYIATSAIGGFGSWTFDQFSLGTGLLWCLFLCLWVLLFVVLPTLGVVGLFIAVIWFAVFSPELRAEIKQQLKRPSPRKRESGSGGFSFLLFLGVCLKVFLDGNWWTPFGSLTYGYFAYVWITVVMWAFIIFGIPAAIIGLTYLIYKHRKSE